MTYEPPEVPGAQWNDFQARYHGCRFEVREAIFPGRLSLVGNWPHYNPEDCCTEHPSEWMYDGRLLICTGCGLDCT